MQDGVSKEILAHLKSHENIKEKRDQTDEKIEKKKRTRIKGSKQKVKVMRGSRRREGEIKQNKRLQFVNRGL